MWFYNLQSRNKECIYIILGTLVDNNALSRTNNASFHTASSNIRSFENIPHTKSQESSSKYHPWSSQNIFSFRKLSVLILLLSLSNEYSSIQSTTASPLPHSHSLSHYPSTSLPRREATRKFPVYPLPASSSIRGFTSSVSRTRSQYPSGHHYLSRRGNNVQLDKSLQGTHQESSSPMSNHRNQKPLEKSVPIERLAAGTPEIKQVDRSRRELEVVPRDESSYENYDNYEDIVEEMPSEKDTLLEELFDTKEKWVNPCGINFSAVIPLNQASTDYVYEPLTDSELLQQIVTQVSKALRQSRRFKEDYVSTYIS